MRAVARWVPVCIVLYWGIWVYTGVYWETHTDGGVGVGGVGAVRPGDRDAGGTLVGGVGGIGGS